MTEPEPIHSMTELLRRHAATRPGEVALIDSAIRLSWAALRSQVDRLTASFGARGFEPGDRIVLQAPTSAEFVIVYLATLQAGAVLVPVNPSYTEREVTHIVSDAGARLLITSSVAVIEAAGRLRAACPQLAEVMVTGRSSIDGLTGISELIDSAGTAEGAGDDVPADGDRTDRSRTGEDLAVLLYTSGTSGRPKGAMLPVRALLANLEQFAAIEPTPTGPGDVVYLPLPLFHVFGLNAGLGMALYAGARMVLRDRFDAERSLMEMAAEQATIVIGAPLEFTMWARSPKFAAGFANVRLALSGSAPLPPDLVGEYAEIGVPLYEGYGLTEASPVITVNLVPTSAPEQQAGFADPKPGSIGRPLPGVEVRLLDSDADPVEPGDLGMLTVRGKNLFLGYWPDGESGPDAEGWFATGDLAVADDDGDYYLVGRRSDLILVNGFNVYPAEVEAVLGRLDGVREVAVLGEPAASGHEGEEQVVAYVVPQPGRVLDPDDLLAAAADSLARFKLPARIVETATLPHTATGKVMKWRLRSARPPAGADPAAEGSGGSLPTEVPGQADG